MSKVTITEVKVLELKTKSGKTLGMFRVTSEWNGMRELQGLSGQGTVILGPSNFRNSEKLLNEVFDRGKVEACDVLQASPSIVSIVFKGA